MTKEQLIAFEEEIAEIYAAGKIRAPVHFADGNEDQVIEIFKMVHPDDWVFSTWRSHYHCLLHGVPPDELKQKIVAGESITLSSAKYRILTSAIVGGIVPIALGTAVALKHANSKRKVWCFVGDMCSESGVFHECLKYATNFDLPFTAVIEDNGISTNTPTEATWGLPVTEKQNTMPVQRGPKLWYYSYKKEKFGHQGLLNRWVTFQDVKQDPNAPAGVF